ncbi:MAG TPA: galactitol-1-phosphate 5-dehydrogenase [Rhodothermales bacterium]|nr:galactitol-1-phosphate 5-dehydrogenase [Rhodothermales bacterium]
MKALVHTAPYRFEYTDVDEPPVGPDDLLVRVQACGICGSDVHGYTGETGRRIPPVIMGHEAAGIVEAVGADVRRFRVGDRVCFDSTVYCNRCEACRKGRYNHCARRQVLGVSVPAFRRDGAMAELVSVPWWIAAPIPETMSFVEASLLEPVSIGLHAVNRARVGGSDAVVIIGAGTIGLCVLQAVRLQSPRWIVVSDLNDARLALAMELGADVTINPGREDLSEIVRDVTEGQGADVTFEVVGFGKTVEQAVGIARTGGRVILVGNLEKRIGLDLQEIISKEISLIGSYASAGEYRQSIDLVASGQIDVTRLASEVRPLSEGQACFDRLYRAEDNLIKIILEPDHE